VEWEKGEYYRGSDKKRLKVVRQYYSPDYDAWVIYVNWDGIEIENDKLYAYVDLRRVKEVRSIDELKRYTKIDAKDVELYVGDPLGKNMAIGSITSLFGDIIAIVLWTYEVCVFAKGGLSLFEGVEYE